MIVRLIFTSLLFLSLLATKSYSAEVDHFSLSHLDVADSTQIIEMEINRLMAHAIERANSPIKKVMPKHSSGRFPKRPGCNEPRLYKQLKWQLARPVVGQLETFAEESENISKRRIPFPKSIYQDFFWQESPSLVLSQRMAAIIKINNIEIGTDKLGHFFTEGLSYFDLTEKLTTDINLGLHFGRWTESLYFGAQTTGVYSYADLTANFNGLRYWNKILAKQQDPLTHNTVSPYISCQNKKWVIVEEFSFKPYIDLAWNERINCSLYRNQQLLEKAKRHQLACLTNRLPAQKYSTLPSLLNLKGVAVLPLELQPENLAQEKAELEKTSLSEQTTQRIKDIRIAIEEWRANAAKKAALKLKLTH